MIKNVEKQLKLVYQSLSHVKKSSIYKNRKSYEINKIYGMIAYESKIKNQLNKLIISYLLHLEKKRKINWIKFGFIKDYFPSEIENIDYVAKFIVTNNVFKKDFCHTVPYIYSASIEVTNRISELNKSDCINEKSFMACELFDLYKIIGKYYLECDGSLIKNEAVDRYITYLYMLEKQLEDKLEENLYEIYKTDYNKEINSVEQ